MKLSISNVSKTYPNGHKALKDVSITIPMGMFGLLGPNGAGKSTLMRTIATLQEPDAGSIRAGRHRRAGAEGRRAPDARLSAAGVRRLSQASRPRICWITLPCSRGSRSRRERKDNRARVAAADQSVRRAQEEAGQFLGRHAAALRDRGRADRQSASHHRGRTDGRPRSGRARALSRICSASSAKTPSSSSRRISSRTSASCARAWRSSTQGRF